MAVLSPLVLPKYCLRPQSIADRKRAFPSRRRPRFQVIVTWPGSILCRAARRINPTYRFTIYGLSMSLSSHVLGQIYRDKISLYDIFSKRRLGETDDCQKSRGERAWN